jgi:subtilisin-like proprotein convertase family protein
MPAAIYNFEIEKGSDFSISFQYNDAAGVPIDLSGKCVQLKMLMSNGDQYVFSSAAPANYTSHGWSLSADNLGKISLKILSTTTLGFIGTSCVYDLDVSDSAGNIRLAAGSISFVSRNIDPLNLGYCSVSTDPKKLAATQTTTTSTPTAPTPTPAPNEFEDLCLPYDCVELDVYSVVYAGSGLNITDLSTSSGSITSTDTRMIENIELAINKLAHSSPQDIAFLLAPPSGNKILLSANHKIVNNNNNFSFMFSNKATATSYLHNISNGGLCNIYDKTSSYKYNNENLLYSFDHLFDTSTTGVWTLYAKDTDPLSSGSLDSWKLIVTYKPVE